MITERTQDYVAHLQGLIREKGAPMYKTVQIEEGRKFFKIIFTTDHQRSVHSFVNKSNGDVYKPASWKAPAKGARFNVVTGMGELLQRADIYGSYLYKR